MVTADRGEVRDGGRGVPASGDGAVAVGVAAAGAAALGEAAAVKEPSGTVAAAEARKARTLRRESSDMPT